MLLVLVCPVSVPQPVMGVEVSARYGVGTRAEGMEKVGNSLFSSRGIEVVYCAFSGFRRT